MSSLSPAAFLQHIPLFAACGEEERRQLAAQAQEIRVAKGEALFRRGDPCGGMHVVVVGKVKLSILARQGAEKVVELIQAGQSLGEAVMFLGQPYPVNGDALEDSLLLFLPAGPLFDACARDPMLSRRLLAGLSMRLHSLLKDVETYSLTTATERVVIYLFNALGEAEAGTVTLPVSKQVIASRLNLTPETFSRILQRLAEDGGIRVDGRDIVVTDRRKLADLLDPA